MEGIVGNQRGEQHGAGSVGAMRKALRFGVTAIAIVGTLWWIYYSLTSHAPLPWLNGWMAIPIASCSIVPVTWVFTSGPSAKEYGAAPLGVGTVVDIQDTNVTINNRPQMRVVFTIRAQDGTQLEGDLRKVLSYADESRFAPGAVMPVRYVIKPKRTYVRVAENIDDAVMADMLTKARLADGSLSPADLRVAQSGTRAQAVVMSMQPTGEVRALSAVLLVGLRVTRPDGSMFDTLVHHAVPASELTHYQVGSVVSIRYFPGDEQNAVIEPRLG